MKQMNYLSELNMFMIKYIKRQHGDGLTSLSLRTLDGDVTDLRRSKPKYVVLLFYFLLFNEAIRANTEKKK